MKVRDLREIWVLQIITTEYICLRARDTNFNGTHSFDVSLDQQSLSTEYLNIIHTEVIILMEFGPAVPFD